MKASLAHIAEGLRPLATAIAELKHDPRNARKHGEKNLEAISASLSKFGQRKPVVARLDGTVIAGNGTLEAATRLGWTSIAVLRVKDDEQTAIAYGLADNRTAELAEWDGAILSELMAELGDFAVPGFDSKALADVLANLPDPALLLDGPEGEKAREELYTKKIKAPIYEPKSAEPPPVASLVDTTKAYELLEEIEKAKLPAEVRGFLQAAAMRHYVFDYEQIAEFYAHAPPDLQRLMERSALVIIDFDKAMEGGFVTLSNEMADAYKESGDAGEEA